MSITNGTAVFPLCGSPVDSYTPSYCRSLDDPPETFCANCGEPIWPDQQAAEVYAPNEGEVTSRLVHAECMRPGEVVA